jgi:hypothetical protein
MRQTSGDAVTKPHCRLKCWQPSHTFQWHANVNGLIAAMAAATSLVRQVLLMRRLPPTLRHRWGGLQNCRQLQPPQRHCIPLPFNHFPLGVSVLHTPREGIIIHSITVDFLFHHRSTHDKNTNLVVFADIMSHGLPIHRSTFSMGGNIGHVLPTNLLVMARIRRGGWFFFASCSFGGTFWETILVEGYLLFCLPFFWFLLVDCYMMHCLSI